MAGFDVAVWCEQHRELYAGHLPCAKCQKDREQAARDAALRRGVERLREELAIIAGSISNGDVSHMLLGVVNTLHTLLRASEELFS